VPPPPRYGRDRGSGNGVVRQPARPGRKAHPAVRFRDRMAIKVAP
jgi:hypothetical protein